MATADTNRILNLEIAMSKPRLDRGGNVAIVKFQYNPTSIPDLQKMTPFVNWSAFLNKQE
jgi:hypothetical protein